MNIKILNFNNNSYGHLHYKVDIPMDLLKFKPYDNNGKLIDGIYIGVYPGSIIIWMILEGITAVSNINNGSNNYSLLGSAISEVYRSIKEQKEQKEKFEKIEICKKISIEELEELVKFKKRNDSIIG